MLKFTSLPFRAILRNQRYWLRSIPLVGPTCDTSFKDHREALIEVTLSILFSTTPIWLVSILLSAVRPGDASFIGYLTQNVKDGEILLLCSALIAPLLYFVFVQRKGLPNFPAARSLMVLAILILLVSVALFTLQRADILLGSGESVDKHWILWWSVIAFGSAVLVSILCDVLPKLSTRGGCDATKSSNRGNGSHV